MKMHTGAVALIALTALVGCKDKDADTSDTSAGDIDTADTDTDDTADTADTADTDVPCEVSLVETNPLYGNASWYYRDALEITFDDAAGKYAAIVVTDGDGADVPLSLSWDDSGFNATVTAADGAWGGSTDYTLTVDICEASTEVIFSTTAYGDALNDDSSSLVDNAYYIDMSQATYTEPAGVGAILALYLSEPLLLGITGATEDTLDVVGAQGYKHATSGAVLQSTGYATWDFGQADFSNSPFFAASGETVFEYDEAEIPVYNFAIEGTFSADASTIGGTSFRGLGDTRNMGPLLGLGPDPGVTCELLEKYGLTCEECPDSEMYCLTLAGDFEDAELLPDVTVEIIEAK
ncbi:MAG: hypothetical protein ACI8RZ_003537 [Myxococcota bacterium]|jgi:hypothetical protein